MLEIIEHFGIDAFKSGIDALLDYSYLQARTVVQSMPDGEYFFADYADEDSVNGRPMRVALTVRVKDDTLEFDYTGSDPQLSSSLNVPTGGNPRHVLVLVGLNYILYTLKPDILLNAGMLKVAHCILPEGTIVNAMPPAAVGMRSLTCSLIQLVTMGAFSQIVPDRLPACPAGGLSIVNVKTMDKGGRTVMASIGPVGGGAGGNPWGDGLEASGANYGFLRNTPVEINEAEVPIRITPLRCSPELGRGGQVPRGPRRRHGVQGFFSEHAGHRAQSRPLVVRLVGRLGRSSRRGIALYPQSRHAARGGTRQYRPGAVQSGRRYPNNGLRRGGYGDPAQRDPSKVLEDVRRGYVALDDAKRLYAVAITGDAIDERMTAQLRSEASRKTTASASGESAHFDFGEYRNRFESRWTRERYSALTDILARVPVAWRYFLKHRIFDALDGAYANNAEILPGPQLIDSIFAGLLQEYPELSALALPAKSAAR